MKIVSELISEKACSTKPLGKFSQQLFRTVKFIYPDCPLVEIMPSEKLILKPAVKIVPFLQKKAYQALLAALETTHQVMTISSAFRLIPQQTVLYKWFEMGLCGITLAYKPGESSHESGLAIDIKEYQKWIEILKKFDWEWMGPTDVVHFTYIGEKTESLNGVNILAFQKLWNLNNPEDLIAESGVFDEKTEEKVMKTPIDGFDKEFISKI